METFIEVVRSYPVLYDTNHEDYTRTKLKNELWKKIADKLNYANGNAAKDQWLKLRECHREALRRQQKKRQQATTVKLWTYQKDMEFLKPYMKNRATVGHLNTCSDAQLKQEEEDIKPDFCTVEITKTDKTDEVSGSIESAIPRKRKKPAFGDPLTRKYTEEGDGRVENEEDLRQNVAAQAKKEDLQNDALYQFFMSMYNITKSLPIKHQRQVRRNVFAAISQAEDDAEYDAQNLQMNNSQFSSSSAAFSTSS